MNFTPIEENCDLTNEKNFIIDAVACVGVAHDSANAGK